MKLIDKLKEDHIGNIYTNEEIDKILEENKYFPIECDEDNEEGIFKYTNTKSQIWVKYIRENEDYLISDITFCTKKKGKTKVRAFRTVEEIKSMMDYFRDKKKYDEFLIFVLGLFFARRIGDTLTLKWSDLYYENGRKKEILNTLLEDKTDKIIDIAITDVAWKYIDWYCDAANINPMEHINEDIFRCKQKDELPQNYTDEEYGKAIEKQEAAYRYQFQSAAKYNGIEGVSTHSTRKSFGRIAHEINKFDPDCLPTLQTVFGHSDLETTKIYIDIMAEKAEKMFNDVGKYISDIDKGIVPAIDNVPVIALKTNDLRDILKQAYLMGRENINKNNDIEIMNQLLSMVDEKRIS